MSWSTASVSFQFTSWTRRKALSLEATQYCSKRLHSALICQTLYSPYFKPTQWTTTKQAQKCRSTPSNSFRCSFTCPKTSVPNSLSKAGMTLYVTSQSYAAPLTALLVMVTMSAEVQSFTSASLISWRHRHYPRCLSSWIEIRTSEILLKHQRVAAAVVILVLTWSC